MVMRLVGTGQALEVLMLKWEYSGLKYLNTTHLLYNSINKKNEREIVLMIDDWINFWTKYLSLIILAVFFSEDIDKLDKELLKWNTL